MTLSSWAFGDGGFGFWVDCLPLPSRRILRLELVSLHNIGHADLQLLLVDRLECEAWLIIPVPILEHGLALDGAVGGVHDGQRATRVLSRFNLLQIIALRLRRQNRKTIASLFQVRRRAVPILFGRRVKSQGSLLPLTLLQNYIHIQLHGITIDRGYHA